MSVTNRPRAIALLSILLGFIVTALVILLFVLPDAPTAEKSEEGAAVATGGQPEDKPSAEADGAGEDEGDLPSPSEETDGEKREPEETDLDRITPRYKIYLVVDDAGHDFRDIRPYLDLPFPLTVAILPDREASRLTAEAVAASGKESILHLPMEPEGEVNPGAGAIYTSQEGGEITELLLRHLEGTPGIIGVNNHMGSRATADIRVMGLVMEVLSERNLFFLDSRTSPDSVARRAAEERGVPFAERSVFLDNDRSGDAVATQLAEAAAVAKEHGYAVAIGHVTSPVVAEVAASRAKALAEEGIAFAPLSELFSP